MADGSHLAAMPPPHKKTIFLNIQVPRPLAGGWRAEGGKAYNPGAGAEVRFATLAGGGRTASVATG